MCAKHSAKNKLVVMVTLDEVCTVITSLNGWGRGESQELAKQLAPSQHSMEVGFDKAA